MPVALFGGYRHLALGDVDSTNTVCLKRAEAGDPGGLWVTATRQLAGKASRGRDWVSEAGNLYASLLLVEPGGLNTLANLTFVASLAIRDAIIDVGATAKGLTLKWPNDVLLNTRKVSGVLLESHAVAGRRIVIAGMGVNVSHFPAATRHPATALRDEGLTTTPEKLFEKLVRCMAGRLDQWQGGAGFEAVRADWLSAAAGLNQPVRIEFPTRKGTTTRTGIFSGIDDSGRLLLDRDGRSEAISAAEIFFA